MNFAITMKPKVVLCENVPGILHAEHRSLFTDFLSGLIRTGYQLRLALMVAVRAANLLPVMLFCLRSICTCCVLLRGCRANMVFRAAASA
jgi:hypothetical protein